MYYSKGIVVEKDSKGKNAVFMPDLPPGARFGKTPILP
jgi:hypothetical protein